MNNTDVELELLNELVKAFERMRDIRLATGDPAAPGVQLCITHLQEYRNYLIRN